MVTSKKDLSTQPLVLFLREHLQQLLALFTQVDHMTPAWIEKLRGQLQASAHRYSATPFAPFLLASCYCFPNLDYNHLTRFLAQQSLPSACFMSQPPARFDSVLVPAGEEAPGSGFVWYFSEHLTSTEAYYLLAHAYGHLALGHLRRGDIYSHYDVLSDLLAPSGPARRWDRAVRQYQHHWFQPLPAPETRTAFPQVEWRLPGFAEAFERFQRQQLDESALAIQAAAAHYSAQLLEVDSSLQQAAQLFPHQKRGAAELAVRLQKLGVALLADSVGLGKTRTVATTIHLLRQHGRIRQAAIFTPSKLERNWRSELACLRLSVGSPGDTNADVIIINKDKFKRLDANEARRQVRGCDLLVIEEAHQDLRHIGNKFHRNLREVAIRKYGLLVTATPWNNRRGDIFAMLQPFAANSAGSEVPTSLFRCFSSLKTGQKEFEQDSQLFRQIYHLTTLQRTRRQLRESGDSSVFYAPRRPHLVNVPYTPEQRAAFATLLESVEQLRLPHFNPVRYLTSPEAGENRLSGIHRFVLLKRAESSMYAFARSLDTLAKKAGAMRMELESIPGNDAAIAAWLRQRYEMEEASDNESVREASAELLTGPRVGYRRIRRLIDQAEQTGQLCALRQTLLADCSHDIQIVEKLRSDFQTLFTDDPKLEAIQAQIHDSLAAGHKVLCISQYADTAQALYQALLKQPILRQRGLGLVVSSATDPEGACQINGQAATREEVLSRFAPCSWANNEPDKQRTFAPSGHVPAELAIVVGSDTLSVGQNLQDARVLIKLDLCWNPMQHEQRIGRIDRPRHSSDAAPLDIFYFLNLDLIEAELQLRGTIEKRLNATYQDTAFDDEILPGYFEMIEHFRRIRLQHPADTLYTQEVNELLETLAERSARPPEVPSPNDEKERAALFLLQEAARFQSADNTELPIGRLLVTMGSIPLYDQGHRLRPNLPKLALLAEIAFQPVDRQGRSIGHPGYHHFFLELDIPDESSAERPVISLESRSILPFVEGMLAEPVRANVPLQYAQLVQLQALLCRLEDQAIQEQMLQSEALRRVKRYRSRVHVDVAESTDTEEAWVDREAAERVEARLVSVRLLV